MKSFKIIILLALFTNAAYSIQMDIGLIRNARIKHVLFETNFGKHTIVSGDFIKHPVAFYITDTLKYINKKKFKIFAYSNSSRSDSYTKILKNIFDEWTQIDKINDEEVLKKIRSDSIDILFDLSGHTAKNRLSIFKHKWFPMQVSWAGFASTTGLNEIDYVIGDENVTPKKNSSHFVEHFYSPT